MLLLLSAADAQGVVWPEEPEEECHEEPEPCLHDFRVNNNIIQDQDDKLGVLKKCESLLSNIMPFQQAVLMPLQTKAPAAKPPASMPPPSTVPASRAKAPAVKPPQPVPGSSPFPRTEAAWRAEQEAQGHVAKAAAAKRMTAAKTSGLPGFSSLCHKLNNNNFEAWLDLKIQNLMI